MHLEFGDGFCTPSEPSARVWHKGDDPVRHRPIAIVGVVDVHLREIRTIGLVHWYTDTITILLTVLALLNVLLLATKW